jgi:hypothetical protein
MKRKILSGAAFAAVIAISAVNVALNSGKSEKESSNVTLANSEAMSQVENLVDYYVKVPFVKGCWMVVGEDTVEGYKIDCFPGSTSVMCPVCYFFE